MKQKNETRKEQISELNDLRKEVDRLSRYCRKLEDENAELNIWLSRLDTQPVEETGEISHAAKRMQIEKYCIYGIDHFCDGSPNRSEDVSDYLPRCPDYAYCMIRKKHVFKLKGEG